MGFDEGRIVFNSDTGIYYSGQTVYGKLIFDQEKEKTFRGIYAKLKGFCYVHWRSHHTRTVHGKRETYYVDHTSREEYVNHKTYLIGSENGECNLPPGHYEYPFQLAIPSQCPSSFEGTHGHIRYELKVVVDRSFKMDQEKKAVIRIIAPLDLNSEPGAKIKFDETYYCCCSRSGSVAVIVKLPYGGYIPGQTIPIEVSCDNNGSVTIDSITFTLKKDTKFHAQGTRSESEDVAKLQMGEVAAGTSRSFTAELLVPYVDTPNVRHCRYIDIDHRIKVTLSPDGCHRDSSESRNLTIGTIPIAGSNYPSGQDLPPQQNVPVITQPLASQYPGQNSPFPAGTTPYPGAESYPSNTPYPGPMVTPYPTTNSPYINRNDQSQYPPPYSATPFGDASYPSGPAPYPATNPSSEKSPYPGPTTTPYPTSNSPYPNRSSPYPTSNPPYPNSSSPYPTSNSLNPNSSSPYPTSTSPYAPTTTPYPTSAPAFNPSSATSPYTDQKPSTGLRTGTFGFIAQAGDNRATIPQLPQGAAVPYPTNPSLDPFAAASAPQPGSPDDDKK